MKTFLWSNLIPHWKQVLLKGPGHERFLNLQFIKLIDSNCIYKYFVEKISHQTVAIISNDTVTAPKIITTLFYIVRSTLFVLEHEYSYPMVANNANMQHNCVYVEPIYNLK